jgi:hypothetical protein
MKIYLSLFISIFLINLHSQAQYDYGFSHVSSGTYTTLTNPDTVLPIQHIGQYIDLGFNLDSYELRETQVNLYENYAVLDFNNIHYSIDIYPIFLYGVEINYLRGEIRIKRGQEIDTKFILIEFSNLEYRGFANEKINYTIYINNEGEIKYRFGENTLSENHAINKKEATCFVMEEDYITQNADSISNTHYFNSGVLVYDNPAAPSLMTIKGPEDEQDPIQYIDSYPSSGTTYHFSIKSFNSVADKYASSIKMHPNPTTNFLNIENAENYASFNILSIDGKILAEGNMAERLDVRNLKPGIYHLQLTKRNGSFSSTKFLKN